jgi:hypothetical protein
MATVLEDCATEEQRSLDLFLLTKGFNAKSTNKEFFPFYCGKCLSRQALHNWCEKRGKCIADEDVGTEVRKWLR